MARNKNRELMRQARADALRDMQDDVNMSDESTQAIEIIAPEGWDVADTSNEGTNDDGASTSNDASNVDDAPAPVNAPAPADAPSAPDAGERPKRTPEQSLLEARAYRAIKRPPVAPVESKRTSTRPPCGGCKYGIRKEARPVFANGMQWHPNCLKAFESAEFRANLAPRYVAAIVTDRQSARPLPRDADGNIIVVPSAAPAPASQDAPVPEKGNAKQTA